MEEMVLLMLEGNSQKVDFFVFRIHFSSTCCRIIDHSRLFKLNLGFVLGVRE